MPKPSIVHKVRMRGVLNQHYIAENAPDANESDEQKLARLKREQV